MTTMRRLPLVALVVLVAMAITSGPARAECREELEPQARTAAEPAAWARPVPGALHVSQEFCPPEHHGLDLVAGVGTPVMAVAAGRVLEVDRDGIYGIHVEVVHPDGLVTLYAHLSQVRVSPDEGVSTGQELGLVGLTGRTSGAHLHFAVRLDGHWLDPLPLLLGGE